MSSQTPTPKALYILDTHIVLTYVNSPTMWDQSRPRSGILRADSHVKPAGLPLQSMCFPSLGEVSQ